jgi:hypothetical protein
VRSDEVGHDHVVTLGFCRGRELEVGHDHVGTSGFCHVGTSGFCPGSELEVGHEHVRIWVDPGKRTWEVMRSHVDLWKCPGGGLKKRKEIGKPVLFGRPAEALRNVDGTWHRPGRAS